MKMKKVNKRELLVLGIFILILVLLRIPSVFEPHWHPLEGFFSSIVTSTSNNLKIYQDVWSSYPPGNLLIYSLANLIPDYSLNVLKISNLVISIGSLILIFKISKKLFDEKVAVTALIISTILLGTSILEANVASAVNFYLFFTLSGIYLVFKKGKHNHLLSGVFFGLAMIFGFKPIFEFLAILLFLLITTNTLKKQMRPLLYLLGFLSPLIIVGIWMSSIGVLEDFYSQVIVYNITNLFQETTHGLGFIFFSNNIILRSLLFIFFCFIALYLFRKKNISRPIFLVTLVSLASVFAVLTSSNQALYNLIQLVPMFSIITALVIVNLLKNIDVSRKLTMISIYFLALFFILNLYTTGRKLSGTVDFFGYYQNFISSLIKKKDTSSYIKFFGEETYKRYRANTYLTQNYPDTDDIYIWTDNPWLYFLKNIKPPVKYLQSFIAVDNLGKVKSDIQTNSPRIIVIDPNSQDSSEIRSFISEEYELENIFEDHEIYLRNIEN